LGRNKVYEPELSFSFPVPLSVMFTEDRVKTVVIRECQNACMCLCYGVFRLGKKYVGGELGEKAQVLKIKFGVRGPGCKKMFPTSSPILYLGNENFS